jgi:hypothetical protein
MYYTLKIETSKSKFLVVKFEFGGSFVISLERVCLEVAPNLKFLVNYDMREFVMNLIKHLTTNL